MRDEIIENVEATYKETDLFKMLQTGDLANMDALPAEQVGAGLEARGVGRGGVTQGGPPMPPEQLAGHEGCRGSRLAWSALQSLGCSTGAVRQHVLWLLLHVL